jgi:hypothetical protein
MKQTDYAKKILGKSSKKIVSAGKIVSRAKSKSACKPCEKIAKKYE